MIEKKDLIDWAYYKGTCRNASIARWDKNSNVFYYWRSKFGNTFVDEIRHPEDDKVYDVFEPKELLTPTIPIPN